MEEKPLMVLLVNKSYMLSLKKRRRKEGKEEERKEGREGEKQEEEKNEEGINSISLGAGGS